MATIRNLGHCPCPRCTTPLSRVHLLGTKNDRQARTSLARVDDNQYRSRLSTARQAIYKQNYDVDSAAVARMLKPWSLVPTSVSSDCSRNLGRSPLCLSQNAFSDRLSRLGLNFFALFLVDLLHEVELGVWKAFFIHLLRILDALDETKLYELDRR